MTQEIKEKVAVRYHDFDALRAVAMILGIALHGALSFVAFPWSVQDSEQHELFGTFFHVIHGFRMPVFFVMSGFFTAMLWRRRGLGSILKQRFMRVFLPCMVGIFTICPLQDWVGGFVYTQSPPAWPFEVEEEPDDSADVAEIERAESLPFAAKFGQRDVVDEFLADGTDVNTRDDWGATALHWAAATGRVEIIKTLFDEGADPNLRTSDGSRPLHWAAFLGRAQVVELLLENGADPNERNQKGEIPLDTVRGPWSKELEGVLNWIAGIMTIEIDLEEIEENRPRVVALLEEAFSAELELDLPSAAKRGELEEVLALLSDGADPGSLLEDRSSGLHWAAVQGHYEIVQALLGADADPNIRAEDGGTPLHWAAFLGEPEMVELLLAEGAEPNIRNRDGLTPLDTISAPWEELEEITKWIAGMMELEVDLEEIEEDRPLVIEALKAAGAEGGGGGSDFDALIAGLMFVNVFHHLWFLWFLCLLVVLFAIYAAFAHVIGLRHLPNVLVVSPLRYLWLLPLTLLPQLMMHGGSSSGFGPDTATGWMPFPHLLFYYAVFFFFGAFYSDCDDEERKLGSRWWLTLPLALLVVFPLGMEFTVDGSWSKESFSLEERHLLGALLQVLFCWLMIFGLMGFFRKFFGRESLLMRYISDSSYWLYLLHLPLIVLGQWFVRDWPISPFIKFALVCGVVTGSLLISYQLLVRYTPIGTFLNGRRKRPAQASVAAD
jgi:ankyrin repeat protein/peptidoglycan/LPS O-acetylase OafA/YrhL